MCRVANRDYKLHGTTIRKGQQVVLMYPSANRDPAHFANPQRFDVTRQPNPHIAFGFGTHFCLGVALAAWRSGCSSRSSSAGWGRCA